MLVIRRAYIRGAYIRGYLYSGFYGMYFAENVNTICLLLSQKIVFPPYEGELLS